MVSVVSLTRAVAATAVVLSVAVIAPAGALAAHDCPAQPAAQTFLPWGDGSYYVPAPDGGFEAGAAGWQLSSGAAVQQGNESHQVGGDADAVSLVLPDGSAATTPPVCIDVAHPTIRFFARNTGSPMSALGVSVVYRGLLGLPVTLPIGAISGDQEWQPGPALPVVVNLLSLLGGASDVTFRFTPSDSAGEWSIDDVYVDPYSKD
jgi:hypothetical protein